MKGKRAVVLLSGGMDSATVLAIAKSEGFAAHALTVRYGQSHAIEVEAAAAVARHFEVEHEVVDVDSKLFLGSRLTSPSGGGSDTAYVPARNTVFLSLALAWCESLGGSDVFLGVTSADFADFPDCRPDYLSAFEAMARLGTQLRDFRVHAPLVHATKADVVRIGKSLGVNFGDTVSCYHPGSSGIRCGQCTPCQLRAEGFRIAGVED